MTSMEKLNRLVGALVEARKLELEYNGPSIFNTLGNTLVGKLPFELKKHAKIELVPFEDSMFIKASVSFGSIEVHSIGTSHDDCFEKEDRQYE